MSGEHPNTREAPTTEPVGAVAALKERVAKERLLNEFYEPALALTETVMPSLQWDEGIKTIVELRIDASYTVFRTDKEHGFKRQRENAYRALSDLLYRDVLRDLRQIIQTAGEGKRRETLNMLSDLYERLRS
jgi:hypothetical protein